MNNLKSNLKPNLDVDDFLEHVSRKRSDSVGVNP